MNIKPRLEGRRSPVRKVLIVCEGAKTEPNYFRAFRVASQVCDIQGTGHNTLSLVKEAVRLTELSNYRETWCVFDRDSFSESAVRAAFKLASQHKFKIAYSNECFELWYLLHFKYLDTEINRGQYFKQLKAELGKYEKNSAQMYDMLLSNQDTAIRNADKLVTTHSSKGDICGCKPYTSVHDLVKRLNQLAAKTT